MQHIITQLEQYYPQIPLTVVNLPDGETLNNVWTNYGASGITQLLHESQSSQTKRNSLEILSENKIAYTGKTARYTVLGGLSNDLSSMRVALSIVDMLSGQTLRIRTDLYDYLNVQNQCSDLSEKHGFDYNLIISDIMELTELLEDYRERLIDEEINPITEKFAEKELTPKASEKAIEFLKLPDLMENINKLLEQSGIVGEQLNRLLLFVVASSYKMLNPLHAIVQASSASGKSHLINSVAECIPQEDCEDNTSFSSKVFYYEKDKALYYKLMVIQDFDGLDEKAQYAFRELQSNKSITRKTTEKSRLGNLGAVKKQVKAHFSSLAATTDLDVYLDNQTRSIMLGVDESEAQTLKIIQRQNQRRAGIVNTEDEHKAKQILRNCMRILKPCKVVNPFADKLILPVEAKSLRRLNEQFQDFICQITLLHQYQRKTDTQGRLVTTKEDVHAAVELFFSAIIIKVDELDASTRQFFDNLKAFVKAQDKGTTYKFNQREVRQYMKLGKTAAFNFMTMLQQLEYIQAVEGTANKGFRYVVSYWDNLDKTKARIKEDLKKQLENL